MRSSNADSASRTSTHGEATPRLAGLAKERQKAKGIDTGLIGVWSCLESGRSYRAYYCAQAGYPPRLQRGYATQCKHLYLYFDHEEYGFMNVRLSRQGRDSRMTFRSA
jgi:hypothetical protein